jgi:hypothetical protein
MIVTKNDSSKANHGYNKPCKMALQCMMISRDAVNTLSSPDVDHDETRFGGTLSKPTRSWIPERAWFFSSQLNNSKISRWQDYTIGLLGAAPRTHTNAKGRRKVASTEK